MNHLVDCPDHSTTGAYMGAIKVSVVIPTYKRHDYLRRCLAALITQECFIPYEVIVADDENSYQTRDLVAHYRPVVRYVPVTVNHGPAAARNAGWRAAVGQAIAFTDDDTIPDSRWVQELWDALCRGQSGCGADAVWGFVNFPVSKAPTDFERTESGLHGAEFVTANVCVWRAVLSAADGFDERFAVAWREDTDLFYTLLSRGMDVRPAPQAIVLHPPRPGYFGISLKAQKKAQYNALLYKKHRDEYRSRIRPIRQWCYYCVCLSLLTCLVSLCFGYWSLSTIAGLVWFVLVAMIAWRRIANSNTNAMNILDILVTSPLVPMLSVFWRIYGAVKFRVLYF